MAVQIISQIQQSLWDTGLTHESSFEMALLILAWGKVSAAQAIPVELRLAPSLLDQPARIPMVLAQLGDSDPSRFGVFGDAKLVMQIDGARFRPAFDLVLRQTKSGIVEAVDATSFADHTTEVPGSMPSEVASFMLGLADLHPADSVYLPWDSRGQLAMRSVKAKATAYVETVSQSTIPALISILSEEQFEVHRADPLRSPSAVERGNLRKFEVSVAFPPLGARYDGGVVEHDWFGRFPERTASGAVLAIRHLLSQTRRRIVVAVQNSLLFSTGAELALRQSLVSQGIVEAVIAMRSGLLSYTNIPLSILLLDPRGGHDRIKFVSAESARFNEAVSKARFRLTNLDELLDIVSNKTATGNSAIVASTKLGSDAQLQVNRYVIPETTKRLRKMISTVRTVRLGDLVETIRPTPLKTDGNLMEVFEVGAADLPPYGYIARPGRMVKIDGGVAEKNRRQFLRAFDIVLIVKGSVGKVGIVPEVVQVPGAGGWVAGQSAIVLRANNTVNFDSRALALQLRSPLGQQLLSSIVSGATIPLIQLRELLNLPIPVPPMAESCRAAEVLDKEMKIQMEIEHLQRLQAQVAEDPHTSKTDEVAQSVSKKVQPNRRPNSARVSMFTEQPIGRRFRDS
jgi:type I restriction enzyme M protein